MGVPGLKAERISFATSKDHFEEVFKLAYKEYLRKSYCSANSFERRIPIYNAVPATVTFCLWRGEKLVGTASLILDSPIGLPMEKVYPEEIQTLRSQGRKMCEVSLLALNSELIKEGVFAIYYAERLKCLYQLFKPLFWYAKATVGYSDLCIACNPKHKALYTSLHFQQFGDEKVYESVNANPSIAMRLDFDHAEDRVKMTPGLYKLFFGTKLQMKDVSENFRWTKEDFIYFFNEKSNVIKEASSKEIRYLSECYPDFGIEELHSQQRT